MMADPDVSMDAYTKTEFFKFMSFFSRARFHHECNLKLAYLLINLKTCALLEAASVLNISRTLFYTRIFPDNPAFLCKKVSVSGWSHGGQENRIKMSNETLAFSQLIIEFAEYHLGDGECQRLKLAADEIKKGSVKAESRYQSRIKRLRNQTRYRNFDRWVGTCARDFGKTTDEVKDDIGGKR